MNKDDHHQRAAAAARDAAEAYQRIAARLLEHTDAPIGPGDLLVLPQTARFPIEWLAVLRDPVRRARLFLVPADTNPLCGRFDFKLSEQSEMGPLGIRLRFGLWVPSQWLPSEARSGCLEPDVLGRVQRRLADVCEALSAGDDLAGEEDPAYARSVEKLCSRAVARLGAALREKRKSDPGATTEAGSRLEPIAEEAPAVESMAIPHGASPGPAGERAASVARPRRFTSRWLVRAAILLLAVATGALGFLSLRLRRELSSQAGAIGDLRRQMELSETRRTEESLAADELRSRAAELERERLRLQDSRDSLTDRLKVREAENFELRAALEQPKSGISFHQMFAEQERSGPLELSIPPAARYLEIAYNVGVGEAGDSGQYQLEIRDVSNGESVRWRSQTLRPQRGLILILFDRGFLAPGSYDFLLHESGVSPRLVQRNLVEVRLAGKDEAHSQNQ